MERKVWGSSAAQHVAPCEMVEGCRDGLCNIGVVNGVVVESIYRFEGSGEEEREYFKAYGIHAL